jgi:hypothetical protein
VGSLALGLRVEVERDAKVEVKVKGCGTLRHKSEGTAVEVFRTS